MVPGIAEMLLALYLGMLLGILVRIYQYFRS